ncbi:VapC toxin family PIN domain ribonuclease [Brasilonema octagenarum UFV-E1]|uniref:VapC toxin family PIN domain ribonuclease n=2 Tax=Brasilonema TaxID=383614 RepID=A0A856MHI1_9CYAN|nr:MULTISPECIES: PIN domain-containing protein [Brasilonema]NMF62898.1 VapC toxin family PIN domain ribonuclease [Brasilonema octagenarum UFV-OR1]QDL10703.1 VapC toxin family PIN domain ribonuclease [Brasilonema sennae CENA114]QDL17047.1 VapC toxin family PIN domain ribonuclease [Brasilonema octagenarum UFV-E1]
MTVEESLQGVTRLFLDSAPVIYAVEENPQYLPIVREIFARIEESSPIGVISPVTLAECLVRPYRLEQTELQQLYIELFFQTENIIFQPITNPSIALEAAQIRARYNLQLPDAFQIAVAVAAGCEAFLTNDVTFKRVTELQVLVLDDFNTAE